MDFQGHRISFEACGTGLPILFIHAGVADSRMWDHQFGAFDGFQTIRFDMRGFGETSLGSKPYTNHDDALAVLDHLGIDRAVVVGCSMGASTALRLASAAPDRVAALVLVSADAPGFDAGIEYESPEWPEAVEAFEAGDLRRVAELEAEMWLAGIDRSTADVDEHCVRLLIDMDLIALGTESAREELIAIEPLERVPDVEMPVLVVVGEHDLPQLRAAAGHLANELSARPPVLLTDTAHLPSMDRPTEFNDVLSQFLQGI
jgi:3-oxoadipate enol-lactonase